MSDVGDSRSRASRDAFTDSVSFTVTGEDAENEIVEVQSEERRGEMSSRKARDIACAE
jgi:hypothetical protein